MILRKRKPPVAEHKTTFRLGSETKSLPREYPVIHPGTEGSVKVFVIELEKYGLLGGESNQQGAI